MLPIWMLAQRRAEQRVLPEFVGVSAAASGTGDIVVPAVSGVVSGDLVLLLVGSRNQGVATPSGYTLLRSDGIGTAGTSSSARMSVFYRIASGADSSDTVLDSGAATHGVKAAYRYVDNSTPFGATNSVNSDFFASVAVPKANSRVFGVLHSTGSRWTAMTLPASIRAVDDAFGSTSWISIVDRPYPSPSASGTPNYIGSVTSSGTPVSVADSIVLQGALA